MTDDDDDDPTVDRADEESGDDEDEEDGEPPKPKTRTAKDEQALDEGLIEYLSTEIETYMTTTVAFRARAHFSIFIAPFAVLGAVMLSKRDIRWPPPISEHAVLWWVLGLILSYALLGTICCRIEGHAWQQCNKWREMIADVRTLGAAKLKREDFQSHHYLGWGYAVAWAAMALGFVSTLALVWALTVPSKT